MIKCLHDSHIRGHSGTLGIYHRIKRIFFWSKLRQDVLEWVQKCDVSQLNKIEHLSYPGLLELILVPDGACKVITMDFICGLSKSEGKNVIMVINNKFTKYYHLIGLAHPFSTATVADSFLKLFTSCIDCLAR
jgi:Integrase zinc binding domain